MTLGELIIVAKTRQKITRVRAAKEMGICIPTLTLIEKNKKAVYSDKLEKIKAVLNFTEEELEFLEEYKFLPKTEERILKKDTKKRKKGTLAYTYHIVIPINFLRELKWEKREPLFIFVESKQIVISKKENKNKKKFIRNLVKLSETNYKISIPWELIKEYNYIPETKIKLTLILKSEKVILENNHK